MNNTVPIVATSLRSVQQSTVAKGFALCTPIRRKEIVMAKMRANGHRGRTGANGKAIAPKHNDRDFDVSKSEHIDEQLADKNIIWKFDGELAKKGQSLDEFEQAFYEKHFSAALEKRNEKAISSRHKDRVQTMEQFRQNAKACPEEVIWNIGKSGNTVDPETIRECFEEYVEWHNKTFANTRIIDAALHGDEPNAAPHIHERQVWFAEKDGVCEISQKDALAAMGIERPDPSAKESRYNNAKVTYTAICRERWLDIAEKHGVDVEREPQDKSQSGLKLLDYKVKTAQEKIEAAEKNLEQLSAQTEAKFTQTVADFISGKGAKKVAAAEKIIENADAINAANLEEKKQLIAEREVLNNFKKELEKEAKHQEAVQRETDDKVKALAVEEQALNVEKQALAAEKKSFAKAVIIKARQIADKFLKTLGLNLNRRYNNDSQINKNKAVLQERSNRNEYDHNH